MWCHANGPRPNTFKGGNAFAATPSACDRHRTTARFRRSQREPESGRVALNCETASSASRARQR
eukprot:4476474-Pyramimonas_sp.AAC.1